MLNHFAQATSLPGETVFWLIAPIVVMFLLALWHSLKNWNKPL